MKSNLLIFLGFAVICLVNISAHKRTQEASVAPAPAVPAPPAKVDPVPVETQRSASSAMSKLGESRPLMVTPHEELR